MLVEFSGTLAGQFGKDAVVGRIGGDEFIAFLSVTGAEMAKEHAGELIRALRNRTEGGVSITASIGVVLAVGKETDFETLYKKADFALYKAKRQGRNRYVIAAADDENK